MYNREEKRKEILLAAVKVFGKDGYHKAKVSDIAKAANIGKGTIYEYFDSKKNLFEEMVRLGIGEYFKEANELINAEKDVLKKLKKYILVEKQMMKEYGNIANIFFQEADKIGKDVRVMIGEARNEKLSIVRNIIKEGIDKKIFRNIDIHLAALAFTGGAHQMLVDELFFCFKSSESKQYAPEEFLKIFISGIKLKI